MKTITALQIEKNCKKKKKKKETDHYTNPNYEKKMTMYKYIGDKRALGKCPSLTLRLHLQFGVTDQDSKIASK